MIKYYKTTALNVCWRNKMSSFIVWKAKHNCQLNGYLKKIIYLKCKEKTRKSYDCHCHCRLHIRKTKPTFKFGKRERVVACKVHVFPTTNCKVYTKWKIFKTHKFTIEKNGSNDKRNTRNITLTEIEKNLLQNGVNTRRDFITFKWRSAYWIEVMMNN